MDHQYFPETVPAPFSIRPSAACAQNLRRLGLIARTTPQGLVVVYASLEKGPEAAPLHALTEELTLDFLITTSLPQLMDYVTLPPPSGPGFFRFSNLWNQLDEGRVLLSNPLGSAYASAHDRMTLLGPSPTLSKTSNAVSERVQIFDEAGKRHLDRNLLTTNGLLHIPAPGLTRWGSYILKRDGQADERFYIHGEAATQSAHAILELRLGALVPEAARVHNPAGMPLGRTFCIRFRKPQTIWRYFVIPRGEPPLDQARLRIKRVGSDEFVKSGEAVIGGETAYVFESSGPLPLQHQSLRDIQLLTDPHSNNPNDNSNFKTQVQHLPNPGLDALDYAEDQGPFFSNIYIYL